MLPCAILQTILLQHLLLHATINTIEKSKFPPVSDQAMSRSNPGHAQQIGMSTILGIGPLLMGFGALLTALILTFYVSRRVDETSTCAILWKGPWGCSPNKPTPRGLIL